MTTTTKKKITIALSDGPPVRIDPELWPRIASANDWSGAQVECQATQIHRITVRQHDDGRTLVYGIHDFGQGGVPYLAFRGATAGYLIDAPQAHLITEHTEAEQAARIVRAIRRVAGAIGAEALAGECIADLPACEI